MGLVRVCRGIEGKIYCAVCEHAVILAHLVVSERSEHSAVASYLC